MAYSILLKVFCLVIYNCSILNIHFSESFWSGNFQLWHILGWRPSSADSWHHWPIRLPRKMSSFNALVKIKMNTITNTNTQTKTNTNTNTTTKTSETIALCSYPLKLEIQKFGKVKAQFSLNFVPNFKISVLTGKKLHKI